MLLKSEAERAISGLGSKGIMYATALKCLKSSLASRVLQPELNCLSIMHHHNYYADVNANGNLRRIVMRLPDYLVD